MKLYLSNSKTVVVSDNGRQAVEPVTTTITSDGNVFVYKYPSGEQIGSTTHYSEVFQADGTTPIGATLALAQDYLISNTVFKPASGGSGAVWGSVTGTLSDQIDLQIELDSKQNELVSATNIKTINGTSVLGSGDLVITGGGGTNPTSGLIPYNSGGSFADTSIEIGSAFGSPTYKFKDSTIVSATYFTDTFLNMDYSVNEYSFGIASFSGGIPSAEIGMAMTGMRMVIGMNMQGGTDGVIRANGNTGVVSIGAFGVEYTLGVNPFGGGVLIGSGFIDTIPPANSGSPAVWINITNENGLQYKVAAYQ